MKFLLAAVLLLSMTNLAHAVRPEGGHEVGGGGIAEKNVVFAYLNLARYLRLCLGTKLCKLEANERWLLRRIHDTLPQEGSAESLIHFESESKRPGFFVVDGHVRIAKTRFAIASPIWVNVDLLYSPDRRGDLKALSLSAAVALLVHELGHHHGVVSHKALDVLGSKVQAVLLGNAQQIDGGRQLRGIQVTVIDFGTAKSFSQILVNDQTAVYDLTERFKEAVQCLALPTAPAFPRSTGVPEGFNFWNAHWSKMRYGTSPVRTEIRELILTGILDLECPGVATPISPDILLSLAYKKTAEGPVLLPEHFRFQQMHGPVYEVPGSTLGY